MNLELLMPVVNGFRSLLLFINQFANPYFTIRRFAQMKSFSCSFLSYVQFSKNISRASRGIVNYIKRTGRRNRGVYKSEGRSTYPISPVPYFSAGQDLNCALSTIVSEVGGLMSEVGVLVEFGFTDFFS
jgi:hypothetical protein